VIGSSKFVYKSNPSIVGRLRCGQKASSSPIDDAYTTSTMALAVLDCNLGFPDPRLCRYIKSKCARVRPVIESYTVVDCDTDR
jgi:hypothetical protein